MLRTLLIVFSLLLLSGCCRVFGICTDVNVHSALDPNPQIAAAFPEPPSTGLNLAPPTSPSPIR
jgi:hypothetical protein